MYQDGSPFQPATVAFSLNEAAISGRWLANRHRVGEAIRQVGAKGLLEIRDVDEQVRPCGHAPGASLGVAVVTDAASEGGNGSCTLAQLSPTSSAKAARKTAAR